MRGSGAVSENAGILGRKRFKAVNPADGRELEHTFFSATEVELEQVAIAAKEATKAFAASSGTVRGKLLRKIADGLTAAGPELVERAGLETGLPVGRLQGELGRTTGQLRLFAEVVEDGSWVSARIDEADSARKPMSKPDLRAMLRPLGPVAVFGASNFPLAFSVAGGDTASALAAGCPVIVKAHPAHPGTSAIAARVVHEAVAACGLDAGVFGIVFDAGVEVGTALVRHPAVRAVAFTGSAAGGKALMRLAADRPEPIPCYAEMGSTNPVFVLTGALKERGAALAAGLVASFTLGSGQFCTKPGVVFVPEHGYDEFVSAIKTGVACLGRQGMLTLGIAAKYREAVCQRQSEIVAGGLAVVANDGAVGAPTVFSVDMDEFRSQPELGEEVFGPTTLLVRYRTMEELQLGAEAMHGHLTATIHGTEEELAGSAELIQILEERVGRILFNGFPTGVEVAHAMVHGGAYPATSDGRSSSVGTTAMLRFVRPVCYQDFLDAALPDALRRGNPLGIWRMMNGTMGRN